jgi:hypothetical protein
MSTIATAAPEATSHTARKLSSRPRSLARTYSPMESGRLSTNSSDCSLRSFITP